MDVLRYIELAEIFIASGYLIFCGKKESHLTRWAFCAGCLSLSVDVFVLHLWMGYTQKSLLLWGLLNVPFSLILYEKILRKLLLRVFRKMAVLVMPLD